jgi:hypothetical protein
MFEKYQHVERYGTSEVEGIEDGLCWVFPKLDGTNASVWWDNGIKAGSRRRELSLADDNHGFFQHISMDNRIAKMLDRNPELRLFGEWLVPHTLKTYRDDAWRKFYVFDVMDDKGYLPYELYKIVLDSFGVDYIPAIRTVLNGNEETFRKIAETNDYLMKPGEIGEGIVIKRYDYVNRYGRITWAKLVRSEFKERHYKAMGPPKIQGEYTAEREIADTYITKTLVDKEKAKIDTKPIQPRLLSTVWHCLLTEEMANIVKKMKNPTIDFKVLNRLVTGRVKELAPELF